MYEMTLAASNLNVLDYSIAIPSFPAIFDVYHSNSTLHELGLIGPRLRVLIVCTVLPLSADITKASEKQKKS
jgi:hypothetical protein